MNTTLYFINFYLVLPHLSGLYRLEQLYGLMNSAGFPLEIDPYRLTKVDHCYELLRLIDQQNKSEKRIVIDLSTQVALATVLRQVSYDLLALLTGLRRVSFNHLALTTVLRQASCNHLALQLFSVSCNHLALVPS